MRFNVHKTGVVILTSETASSFGVRAVAHLCWWDEAANIATGDSLPCGLNLLAPLTGNGKVRKEIMVLRVLPTRTSYPIDIHYTVVENTALRSILSVWRPWGKSCYSK